MLKNIECGIRGMIAVGTFEIGMEFLLLHLARSFDLTIWMKAPRREFLKFLTMDHCTGTETTSQQLYRRLEMNDPAKAQIHVLDVKNIHRDVSSTNLCVHITFLFIIFIEFSFDNI